MAGMPKCVFVAFMPNYFNDHQGVHATSKLRPRVDFLSWALCLILRWRKCRAFYAFFKPFNIGPECHYPPDNKFSWVFMPFQTFHKGLKAKFSLRIFQKNCSSGVYYVNIRYHLITISSRNQAPDISYRELALFLFQT